MVKLVRESIVESKNVPKKFWKDAYLPEVGDLKVYFVDGTYVRDNIHIDFTMGGHGYVYDYVPKDEVWLDRDMNEKDAETTLAHELTELNLMKNEKMSYEKAHKIASKKEKKLRKE